MAKNLFISDSYVSIIKYKMGEIKEQWGLISKLSEACECQRSHFSRVIAEKAELTLEQAEGLCQFFHLSEVESEYFLNLVQYKRAGTKALRTRIERTLKRIRSEQEDLSRRLKRPALAAEEKEIQYYSAWYWSAIHVLVSIPDFQTTQKISKKLSLSEEFVEYCLETLGGFGLVAKDDRKWVHTSTPIHLSKRSPLIGQHHANWRARATLSSQNPFQENLHYTVVQSISRQDFEKVKQNFLATIDEYTKIASPSKEEDLACFCIDWFQVS